MNSDEPGRSRDAAGKPESLLRFISRGLEVQTLVAKEGEIFFVQLIKDGQVVAKRRLAKGACCHSDSPCIGTIPIPADVQLKYGLPSFVHVSFCYDQVRDYYDRQNQMYPRTL